MSATDALEIAQAIYAGVPGGRPERDADQLRALATWLDKLDDRTDAMLANLGSNNRVARDMQADLRRIADRIAR